MALHALLSIPSRAQSASLEMTRSHRNLLFVARKFSRIDLGALDFRKLVILKPVFFAGRRICSLPPPLASSRWN
jgi:hypothetical protein